MKNYVLLNYDKSCSGFLHLFGITTSNEYRYPIVYEDGLVSRLKSAAKGRTAWGILFQGYIIAIRPVEETMTPSEVEAYCEQNCFAGLHYCIVKGTILKSFIKQRLYLNKIINELGGVPFSAVWYIAKNNEFGDLGGYTPKFYGIHPHSIENNYCWKIDVDTKTTFYPAIQL